MSKELHFNLQGGFAYDPEKFHGERDDLHFTDIKGDDDKKEVLQNILKGSEGFEGIDALIDAIDSDNIREDNIRRHADALLQGIQYVSNSYMNPLLRGVSGRMSYVAEYGTKGGVDFYIEVDKIVKDLALYMQRFQADTVYKNHKESLEGIYAQFQKLRDAFAEGEHKMSEDGSLIVVQQRETGKMNRYEFNEQALALCKKAHAEVMRIERETPSNNFARMRVLANELRENQRIDARVAALRELKTLAQAELSN